jgi:Zn-dependent peptidase ImmA (M78 family)
VREVGIEGTIGLDERLSERWVRWLTAHAIGHHLLHTGTSLYLESWQWVDRLKAERQAEEFAADLLLPQDSGRVHGHRGVARRCGIPDAKAELAWSLLER